MPQQGLQKRTGFECEMLGTHTGPFQPFSLCSHLVNIMYYVRDVFAINEPLPDSNQVPSHSPFLKICWLGSLASVVSIFRHDLVCTVARLQCTLLIDLIKSNVYLAFTTCSEVTE